MMKCTCVDWRENIGKFDGMCLLAANHRQAYDGKIFRFCPWCGKRLK